MWAPGWSSPVGVSREPAFPSKDLVAQIYWSVSHGPAKRSFKSSPGKMCWRIFKNGCHQTLLQDGPAQVCSTLSACSPLALSKGAGQAPQPPSVTMGTLPGALGCRLWGVATSPLLWARPAPMCRAEPPEEGALCGHETVLRLLFQRFAKTCNPHGLLWPRKRREN